jgi:hypothetical protein
MAHLDDEYDDTEVQRRRLTSLYRAVQIHPPTQPCAPPKNPGRTQTIRVRRPSHEDREDVTLSVSEAGDNSSCVSSEYVHRYEGSRPRSRLLPVVCLCLAFVVVVACTFLTAFVWVSKTSSSPTFSRREEETVDRFLETFVFRSPDFRRTMSDVVLLDVICSADRRSDENFVVPPDDRETSTNEAGELFVHVKWPITPMTCVALLMKVANDVNRTVCV